jgi:NAD(P)-dependent dehydrogenase (short-subunit alcohol dehydrogenase family)
MHATATHELLATIHPVGRMGEVQDIVDAVLYLESASFVTGEILHVDGGEAAGVGLTVGMTRKSTTEQQV